MNPSDLLPDENADGSRIPPGQKAVKNWPVLHYDQVPEIDLETWRFELIGLVEEPVSLTWVDIMKLPQVEMTNDIHCVTAWSRLDNRWAGVRVQDVLKLLRLRPEARFVTIHAVGGYTTNLTLDDLDRPENLLAHSHDGEPLTKEHGWPLRLVVPHLYFWKSAKWVSGFSFEAEEEPGFWESYGYHMRGDPWKQQRYDGW